MYIGQDSEGKYSITRSILVMLLSLLFSSLLFSSLLFSSLLFSSLYCQAQKISVVDFRLDKSDLTANNIETQVLDQNGEKCALIRVQTTQKGFTFDNGSLGISKVDDNHIGEIWVYVPYGTRHISIRHKDLGSLSSYDFPLTIQKARTYILEISSDKVFVNNYDDTKRQTVNIQVIPAKSILTINGVVEYLDNQGKLSKILSFGKYTYRVESEGFYPKVGQVTINDEKNAQYFLINDLRPIMGKVAIHTNAPNATYKVDGNPITSNSALEPYSLQIGKHTIEVSAKGFRSEQKVIDILENQTADIMLTLSKEADFIITSTPSGARISIDREALGLTPTRKVYTSGTHRVQASKKGYKDFDESVSFDSQNPAVNITLKKILNYKNEFYIGGGANLGSSTSFGGDLGFYIKNVNIEGSYYFGSAKSEDIYWSGNDEQPTTFSYSPSMQVAVKGGYAIPIATRFRVTPQVGVGFTKLNETAISSTSLSPGQGANVTQAIVGAKFSVALVDHLALSIAPEYRMAVAKSKGYDVLSKVSPKISSWGQGFNIKIGIAAFFNL